MVVSPSSGSLYHPRVWSPAVLALPASHSGHLRYLYTRLSQSPTSTIDSDTNCWGDSRGTPVDHEPPHKEV
ncbi:hypothetical protein GmHk_19G054113 [Glycine max]|nr:hypothetical protein GmHk_19G054113 [Glycine max]